MSFATNEELSARWPSLASDPARTQALLDDAAVWLRVWYPDIPEPPTGALADVLRLVSLQMVRRAIRSESYDGRESMSETAGPYSVSVKLSNPDGNLFLTAQERDGLEALLGARVSRKKARGIAHQGW